MKAAIAVIGIAAAATAAMCLDGHMAIQGVTKGELETMLACGLLFTIAGIISL